MPLQRVRAPTELEHYLESREPVTTAMLLRVPPYRRGRRAARAWWVIAPDATRRGVVLLERLESLGSWRGHVLLEDPACAADVAALIQRSPARSFVGPESSVEPVRGLVARASANPQRRWFFSWPPLPGEVYEQLGAQSGIVPVEGAECRLATSADLEALTALYASYELNGAIALRHLRTRLRAETAEGGVAVALVDNRIAAAASVQRTHRYALTNSITVPPEYRGRGLGGALASWQNQREAEAGRGACGERARANGMRTSGAPAPGSIQMVFSEVALAPRIRFRGRERLRVMLVGLHGRRAAPRRAGPPRHSQVP